MMYGRVLPTLRCSDVPLYDSVVDSHAHGLSFPPALAVVGALMLKQWVVHMGRPSKLIEQNTLLDDPPFQHERAYDHKGRGK